MSTTDWLIVETFDNWKVDKRHQFSYFGISERHFYLNEHIKAGDNLFTYVTRKSAFSDIREVTKDGLRPLPMGGDYQKSLPYCIDTKPALVLPPDKWVSIYELIRDLKFIGGQANWMLLFRSAPKRLEKADAMLLRNALSSKLAL
jgi:predicted RNA-binding protein